MQGFASRRLSVWLLDWLAPTRLLSVDHGRALQDCLRSHRFGDALLAQSSSLFLVARSIFVFIFIFFLTHSLDLVPSGSLCVSPVSVDSPTVSQYLTSNLCAHTPNLMIHTSHVFYSLKSPLR